MTVAIIWAGVMGESLLSGLIRSGRRAEDLLVGEKRRARATELEDRYGVAVVTNVEAARRADTVMLVVKPQDMGDLLEELAPRAEELAGPPEPPTLVHGDLWAGNRLVDVRGRNWLIDPSAYWGHREVDLAMMLLFGGFGEECLADLLAAGIDGIEHGTGFRGADIEAAAAAVVAVVPTLVNIATFPQLAEPARGKFDAWADHMVALHSRRYETVAALHEAGHVFPGHTELLAHFMGVGEVSMMLSTPKIKVIHVTTHIGLIDAIAKIEPGLVERTVRRGW